MGNRFLYNAFFLLLLFSGKAFSMAADGKLSGKVVDASNGEAVDFAAVAVFRQSDNAVIKSYMTEKGGKFEFSNLPYDTYKIKISFIGYVPQVISNIRLTKTRPFRNMGVIRLKQDANTLKEVVVTDSKPPVQFGADTITYNVDQSILAEGSMASDILKNVPMVDVDIDGKASIAGKRNTRIFIDGKPSDYMTSNIADLLSVLPSDAIDKVEVITNPDVKYSADGEGIINIALKKGYKIGLNGTLSANAGTQGVYSGNAYVAYRTDSLSLTTSYGYKSTRNTSNSYSLTENYKEDIITSYRNRYNNGQNNNGGHNLRSTLDWDIDQRQNLRISANANLNDGGGDSYSDDHRLNRDAIEQELRQQNNFNGRKGLSVILDADYTLKLNKNKGQLELGLMSSINNISQDRLLERSIYNLNNSTSVPVSQSTLIDQHNRGIQFSADYRRPVSKRSTLLLGLQSIMRTNDNDQVVKDFDYLSSADTVNNYLTNKFTFYENIYSAYASISTRTKSRWSFRLGTRAELTDVRFKQDRTGDNDLKPYLNIFPNLSVSKMFLKKYTVGLSYSVRINRPRDNQLNPLIDNRDSTNIFYGNPGLDPSYTQQAELSFGTFGMKWSLSPRIGYSKTTDIIERIRMLADDQGNVETTFKNLASSSALNFNIFGNYRPTKKISTNAGFSLSKITYHSEENTNSNRNGLSYRTNMGLAIQFPKKVAFEGNLNYYNNASAQGRNKASVSSSFGARKLFLQNKLNVRLMATDPFNQRSNTELIEGLNYHQERYSTQYTRNFSLALSYRFTKVGRNTVNKQKKDINDKSDAVLGD